MFLGAKSQALEVYMEWDMKYNCEEKKKQGHTFRDHFCSMQNHTLRHLHLCGLGANYPHALMQKNKLNLLQGEKPTKLRKVFGDPNGFPHFNPPCQLNKKKKPQQTMKQSTAQCAITMS